MRKQNLISLALAILFLTTQFVVLGAVCNVLPAITSGETMDLDPEHVVSIDPFLSTAHWQKQSESLHSGDFKRILECAITYVEFSLFNKECRTQPAVYFAVHCRPDAPLWLINKQLLI
jgi:hypothetical protein